MMTELTLELDRTTLHYYLDRVPPNVSLIPFIEALLTAIASEDNRKS